MKLKYYLRGIGIGIIMTTIILMIAFSIHKQQLLTDDEILKRAGELGMVMAQEGLPVSDKLADTKDVLQADDEPGTLEDSSDKSSVADEEDQKQTDVQNVADAEAEHEISETENLETQKEVIKQAEITIVGGEYSDDVCKKLKKAGIIEDADDFNKYLAKGGYDNLIQPGNHVIPLDADYDEIIRIITERKNTKKR